MDSISLYIHIPFCEKKCSYCDFPSYSGKKHLIPSYIKALKKEIILYKPIIKDLRIKTIFFGGGTPSILSSNQMAEIMNTINENYCIEESIEITIEANPGTLTYEKLKGYYEVGINRISMGLQSCEDKLLKKLGRIHSFEDFIQNLKDAKRAGFSNVNVDLMFALPGQTEEQWKKGLEQIALLDIPHISAYSLIVEEDTPLCNWVDNKEVVLPDEEAELNMYHFTIEYLKRKGYEHYEISNFAKPGFKCEHNITYWQNQPYIGIGSGAHSYFNQKRVSNVKEIESYIELLEENNKPIEEEISVLFNDEVSETMFLGLRMTEGVSIKKFTERFNKSPFEIYKTQLEKLKEQNLLEWNDEWIKLTTKGIDLSNIVFVEMLLD